MVRPIGRLMQRNASQYPHTSLRMYAITHEAHHCVIPALLGHLQIEPLHFLRYPNDTFRMILTFALHDVVRVKRHEKSHGSQSLIGEARRPLVSPRPVSCQSPRLINAPTVLRSLPDLVDLFIPS